MDLLEGDHPLGSFQPANILWGNEFLVLGLQPALERYCIGKVLDSINESVTKDLQLLIGWPVEVNFLQSGTSSAQGDYLCAAARQIDAKQNHQ